LKNKRKNLKKNEYFENSAKFIRQDDQFFKEVSGKKISDWQDEGERSQ